jgi:hypothetical protein
MILLLLFSLALICKKKDNQRKNQGRHETLAASRHEKNQAPPSVQLLFI